MDRGFEAAFRLQFPRLLALGLATGLSREDAADLAQETMARLHARWEEVSQMQAPEGWTRRVMVNLVIDHHRRHKVEQSALGRLAARPVVERSSPAGGEVDLGGLLAVLPPRQRAVVAMYYLEDVSLSEIADALGIATGTVKASLFKARQSLAARLGSER